MSLIEFKIKPPFCFGFLFLRFWSPGLDLNQVPSGLQPDALPVELTGAYVMCILIYLCHTSPCRARPCRAVPSQTMPRLIPAIPHRAAPHPAGPCQAKPDLASSLPHLALPGPALPRRAPPYRTSSLPCLALPCLASPCLASPCLASPRPAWPRPAAPRLIPAQPLSTLSPQTAQTWVYNRRYQHTARHNPVSAGQR